MNCAGKRKCNYFSIFDFLPVFGSRVCRKKTSAISSQMAKSWNLVCLVFFVLAVIASSWRWRRLKLWRRHGPSKLTFMWKKRRHRSGVARASQAVCASAHTKASAFQSNFPRTHLRRTTRASVAKRVLRFRVRFELVRVRNIANPGKVKKTVFCSRRNSNVFSTIGFLDTVFWDFRNKRPVASA